MIQRRTPLKRTPLKRKFYRIPKRSKSPVRIARQKLYEDAREQKAHEVAAEQQKVSLGHEDIKLLHCEWGRCRALNPDCHHVAGRTGTNLFDKDKLRFLCRKHHQVVHHNPAAARERGFMQ